MLLPFGLTPFYFSVQRLKFYKQARLHHPVKLQAVASLKLGSLIGVGPYS
jgi:hypothetical protein